jgi:hypothetical protein
LVWLSERAFDGHRSWAAALDALEVQFDAEDSCLDTLLQVCVDALNRFTHVASSIIMRVCVCVLVSSMSLLSCFPCGYVMPWGDWKPAGKLGRRRACATSTFGDQCRTESCAIVTGEHHVDRTRRRMNCYFLLERVPVVTAPPAAPTSLGLAAAAAAAAAPAGEAAEAVLGLEALLAWCTTWITVWMVRCHASMMPCTICRRPKYRPAYVVDRHVHTKHHD